MASGRQRHGRIFHHRYPATLNQSILLITPSQQTRVEVAVVARDENLNRRNGLLAPATPEWLSLVAPQCRNEEVAVSRIRRELNRVAVPYGKYWCVTTVLSPTISYGESSSPFSPSSATSTNTPPPPSIWRDQQTIYQPPVAAVVPSTADCFIVSDPSAPPRP